MKYFIDDSNYLFNNRLFFNDNNIFDYGNNIKIANDINYKERDNTKTLYLRGYIV